MGKQPQRSVKNSPIYSVAQVVRCIMTEKEDSHFLWSINCWQDARPAGEVVCSSVANPFISKQDLCTWYLSTMWKPTADCNLRRQIGHRSNGRRSDSSRWLEPCITHCSHWQWWSPKMCPISWVRVWNTGLILQIIVIYIFPSFFYSAYTGSTHYSTLQNGPMIKRFHFQPTPRQSNRPGTGLVPILVTEKWRGWPRS